MRKWIFYGLLFLLVSIGLIGSGCSAIGAAAIALNAKCKVKINARCVKGACELYNGLLFERLTVLQKDSLGLPRDYIVHERFSCLNPGVDGAQTYWPRKIYFHKPNGHYIWRTDTLNLSFKQNGPVRELASGQKSPPYYFENMIVIAPTRYTTCPMAFQKDCWYRVHISDQRLRTVFLYIDRHGRRHIHQTNSGLCPI